MRSTFLLIFCIICFSNWAGSQNVGVGTTNPTEKLDVNGNLNINGNLKIRGNAGQSGQVLSIDGSGQQVWARLSEESYSQRTSTEYVTVRKYGDGGINMYNPNVCQRGTHFTFNSVSFLNIGLIYGGLAGNLYLPEGTGGAGGNTPDGQWGYDGGFGMVVISW